MFHAKFHTSLSNSTLNESDFSDNQNLWLLWIKWTGERANRANDRLLSSSISKILKKNIYSDKLWIRRMFFFRAFPFLSLCLCRSMSVNNKFTFFRHRFRWNKNCWRRRRRRRQYISQQRRSQKENNDEECKNYTRVKMLTEYSHRILSLHWVGELFPLLALIYFRK